MVNDILTKHCCNKNCHISYSNLDMIKTLLNIRI